MFGKRQRVGFCRKNWLSKTYMNLLKMRFEDSLEYELKVVNPDQKLK
jgi:hypothetical protein